MKNADQGVLQTRLAYGLKEMRWIECIIKYTAVPLRLTHGHTSPALSLLQFAESLSEIDFVKSEENSAKAIDKSESNV